MRALALSLAMCAFVCGCGTASTGLGSTDRTAATAPGDGGRPANGAIIDGTSGQPVASIRANGTITAAAADGAGGWFIAGSFTTVDGVARGHLAHVRADGSLDARWHGPRLGPAAATTFLSLAREGSRVLVAGAFSAAGRRRPGVIGLRAADGTLDRAWTTPRVCSDGDWAVRAGSGHAFVATACAAPPCLVAVSGVTGRLLAWSARIAAIGETGCVNDAVAVHGVVYFTGGFTAVGGWPRSGIAAARSADGRVIAGFVPSGSCADDGDAIAAAGDRVFVGGGTCPAAAFAAASGRHIWAWPRSGDATTNVLLAAFGRVYVGGVFARLAGAEANGLAALDPRTGRPLSTWHPAAGSEIFALSASGGRILIGAQ